MLREFKSLLSRQGRQLNGETWSRKSVRPKTPTEFDSLAFLHFRKKRSICVKRWKTLSDVPVPDIVEFVRAASKQGQTVHVGTDSLQTGRYTQFVTVVVVLNPGKGGRAVFQREVLPRITSLRERLLKEVWKSVELGLELSPNISSPLHIHIDANSEEKYMSSRYIQELVGLVVGQGFKAIIKPDAWASSHCADHIVRTKGKQPQSVLRDNVLRRAG